MQEINITQFLEVSPNGIIKGVKKNPINPYKESSEEKALRELLNNKNVADFLFIIGNHHTKSIAEGAFSNVFGLTRQPKGIMLGDIIQDNK
ncbi:hypothetical protein FACS1894166_09790 [Bacilli bacterium]|nr:hypothetical protein FACS1894166_09790 [Bacilli bacterium]